MNKDQKFLAEAYDQVQTNESTAAAAIGLGPLVAKTLMDMAGGNPYLAVGYFLLFYGVIPGAFMAWLTYDMNDVKKMISRVWASIRGRTTLDPDKVEEAATKAKALLKGPEKGKITRLVNDMKFYIERGDMGRAQEVADILKDLLK